jgi:transcriptional regulator GlxA family with amidase domain
MNGVDCSFASSTPETLSDQSVNDKAVERHYSAEEIGRLWGLSPRTVRRMFEKEPGILVFGNMGSMKKRRYLTLRIPESVLVRVHRRLRKAS